MVASFDGIFDLPSKPRRWLDSRLLARKCDAQIVRVLFLEAWPSGNSVLEFKSLRFRQATDQRIGWSAYVVYMPYK